MKRNCVNLVLGLLMNLWAASALAQPQLIINGAPVGGKVRIDENQKLMLDAAAKAMHQDYRGAAALYDQIIAHDGRNIDAYLQRGVMRNELGDQAGSAADGRITVTLANAALQATPRDASLYYKRGMGFRLMKNFDQARKDITAGMQLGGPSSWQTDLQAIALEQKEAR